MKSLDSWINNRQEEEDLKNREPQTKLERGSIKNNSSRVRPINNKIENNGSRGYEVRNKQGEITPGEIYILLSADYDPQNEKVYLKFYDIENEHIVLWYDITEHRPYAYSKVKPEDLKSHPEVIKLAEKIIDLKTEKKHDPINDREIEVTKIIVKDTGLQIRASAS